MLKVNNQSTRTRCEICSKLTIKTLERRQAFKKFKGILSAEADQADEGDFKFFKGWVSFWCLYC